MSVNDGNATQATHDGRQERTPKIRYGDDDPVRIVVNGVERTMDGAVLMQKEDAAALLADNDRLSEWLLWAVTHLRPNAATPGELLDWYDEQRESRAQRTAALAASARSKLTEEEAAAFLAMPHAKGAGS